MCGSDWWNLHYGGLSEWKRGREGLSQTWECVTWRDGVGGLLRVFDMRMLSEKEHFCAA